MNRGIKKVYYIIPVIYFAVVGILFFFQFRKSETFTETIGGFEISGTYSETGGGRDGKVKEITVSMGDIGFRFSAEDPLTAAYAEGEKRALRIERYRPKAPEAFELHFSEGTVLTFSASPDGNRELFILPKIPAAGSRPITRISLPYTLPPESSVRRAEHLPIIAVTVNGANSAVFIDRNTDSRAVAAQPAAFKPGTIETSPEVFTFTAGPEGSFGRLVFKSLGGREIDPLRYWFTEGRQLADESTLQARMEAYRNDAYTGLRDRRFDPAEGGWIRGDGSRAFTEELFLAAASEALYRQDYDFFLELMDTAETEQEALTFRSTCFTGGLEEGYENLTEESSRKLEEIQRRLETGDPEVFSTDRLLSFILTRAPFSLLQNVFALAGSVRFEDLSLARCIDLLAVHNEAVELLSPLPAQMERLRQVIDERILPAVIKTDDGYYLPSPSSAGEGQPAVAGQQQEVTQAETQTIDLLLSLRAGIELRKISGGEYAELYNAVGREMISAVLSAGNESGFIPRAGTVAGEELQTAGEAALFGPEIFFPDLFAGVYVPRFVPLHRENGPGNWLFTAARILSSSFSENEVSITFRFPENLIHHFYLQGIGRFDELILHDLRWPSDPNFEIYSSGWVYEGEERSLKVKLEHRQAEETVILNF